MHVRHATCYLDCDDYEWNASTTVKERVLYSISRRVCPRKNIKRRVSERKFPAALNVRPAHRLASARLVRVLVSNVRTPACQMQAIADIVSDSALTPVPEAANTEAG